MRPPVSGVNAREPASIPPSRRAKPRHHRILIVTRLLSLAILITFAALVGGGGLHAQGNEQADLEVVGFSADGTHFGFLQSGKQNGSNFPFADLVVVEAGKEGTARDTPVRVVLQDSAASPESALMRIDAQTWPLVRDLSLFQRGRVLWRHNPTTPETVERRAVVELPKIGAATIRLTQTATPGAESCPTPERTPQAIRIDLLDSNNAPLKRLSGERAGLDRPDCPIAYGIADIRILELPRPNNGAVTFVAITLAVFRPGMDGNSRRFMAILTQLD
jgi:predicted secreted protein